MYTWNFQLAPISIPLQGADFLQHFNLLVNVKGRLVVHVDCPESVILQASPGPVPVFQTVSFLSAPQRVQKLLEDFPDILSLDRFNASKPLHGVGHHLLTNPGPLIFAKPWRLDPKKLAAAKEEFAQMEKVGIIQCSMSPWSPPLHMVKKKDRGWRPCGS